MENIQLEDTKDTIVTMQFGSYLYGTNTPQSDIDIKGIYMPSAQDIILQKVSPVVFRNRIKKHGEKNTATDVDYELYSPEKFLQSVAQGQSFALEMLFAPDKALLQPPSAIWNDIKLCASQLLSKQAMAFVGYCRQQEYTYCHKKTSTIATPAAPHTEQNKKIDWKGLSHAVRISYQAIEFFRDHRLTFPRPERAHLLAIKHGSIPLDQVTQEIEQLMIGIEQAMRETTLPEKYDPQRGCSEFCVNR